MVVLMTTNDTTTYLPGLALINNRAERRFKQAQERIARTGTYNDGHWRKS